MSTRDPATGLDLGPDLSRAVWWLLLLVGLITLGLGIVVLVWPDRTVFVVVVIAGIFLFVGGVFRFVYALAERDLDGRWIVALVGVLSVLVGLIVMRNPRESLELLVLLLGLIWVLSGAVDLFQAIAGPPQTERGLRAGFGAFWIILGLVLLFWPEATVLVIALLIGIHFTVSGLVQIVMAFQVRQAAT